MFDLYDIWNQRVFVGDTVIASRPSGAGSSELAFCEVMKIREKSVTLRLLNPDGTPKEPGRWEAESFTLQKNHGKDKCRKIVKHSPEV